MSAKIPVPPAFAPISTYTVGVHFPRFTPTLIHISVQGSKVCLTIINHEELCEIECKNLVEARRWLHLQYNQDDLIYLDGIQLFPVSH